MKNKPAKETKNKTWNFHKPEHRDETDINALLPGVMKVYHKSRVPKPVPSMQEIFAKKTK